MVWKLKGRRGYNAKMFPCKRCNEPFLKKARTTHLCNKCWRETHTTKSGIDITPYYIRYNLLPEKEKEKKKK